MNEKWNGHYIYGEGYPDNLYGQAVRFDIKCTNDDGSLTGTCIDEITEKYYNHLGNHRMVIYPNAAEKLITRYFKTQ